MKRRYRAAALPMLAAMLVSSCTDISDSGKIITQQGITLSGTVFTTTSEADNASETVPPETQAITIAAQTRASKTEAVPEEIPENNSETDTDKVSDRVTGNASNGSGRAVIAFAGDVTQSDVFGEVSDNYGLDYSLGDVAPIFSAADIAFVNLETSVSLRGQSEKKEGYGFRTSPDKLEVLTRAGIDIVSVANNHVRDFGMDAFLDTFESLDDYGIDYVGAGKDISAAERLIVYNVNGLKIGFTACNAFIEKSSWYATDGNAGINCTDIGGDTANAYLKRIKEYDKQCDVLFVSVHWGIEYFHGASDDQRRFAHQLCDNGADIILGHHPHVLEPIESYNGKMIFYSLGNFLFYKMDDYAGRTAIFTVEVDKNGFVSGRLQPVNIDYCRSNLLKSDSEIYAGIIDLVNEMSAADGIYIDENGGINLK